MSEKTKHGSQFDADRYENGTESNDIEAHYQELWEPRNIIAVEPDEVYDNYAENKEIHQVVDYCGIDYIIDPLDGPIFGVNHREHTPTDATLRFDLRASTGTEAKSELDKIISATESLEMAPKFASRLKRAKDGSVEWVRIIDLLPLAQALDKTELTPNKTWNDGDVEAWMFDYNGLLDGMGVIEYDSKGGSQ